MNIYVYSDESGVFDKVHNKYFVFAGIILLGTNQKDAWSRKFAHVENALRASKKVSKQYELKATNITNSEKNKLFRALNNCYKFGVVVNQEQVLSRIFQSKKDKQRYLDYVYKIAVKRAFEQLITNSIIKADEIERLYFYADEHTTATNGRYELREALEQEFKLGTYNSNYNIYYSPIFRNMKDVKLEYCNSATKLLVRAADIVANKLYFLARSENKEDIKQLRNFCVIELQQPSWC